MAKAKTQIETVTTTTVTLVLTDTEALNLQRLLGNHITGGGDVWDSLVDIWNALKKNGPKNAPEPLTVKGSGIIYIIDGE